MPINAKIYILVKGRVDFDQLTYLRGEIKRVMGLDDEDFYSSGPLIVLDKDDYLFIPATWSEYTWIDINIFRNYYGVGYERGGLDLFIRIAEWLEKKFPVSQIYYGNDCADETLRLFDEFLREHLLGHYRKVG
jgi:hypothetical protein